jgi:hypothetical protein
MRPAASPVKITGEVLEAAAAGMQTRIRTGLCLGDLVEGRETGRTRRSVAEKMLIAIQEFDQRSLDVVVPLVPRFEREVFKAQLGFLLRHLSGDHNAGTFECEVLKACFCG